MPDRRSGPAPVSDDLRGKLEELCDRLAAGEPQARQDRDAARRALEEGTAAESVAIALIVRGEQESELRQMLGRFLLHNPGARQVTPAGELPQAADGTRPQRAVRARPGSHAKRKLRVIEGGAAGAGAVLAFGLRGHLIRTAVATTATAASTAAVVAGGAWYLTPSVTHLPAAAPASAPSLAPQGVIPLPVSVVPEAKGKHHRKPVPAAAVTRPPVSVTPSPQPPATHAALPPVPLYLSTTAVQLNAGTGTLTLTAGTSGRAVSWSASSRCADLALDQEHGILSAGQEITIGLRLTQPDPAGWCTVTVMWDGQEIPVRVTWDTRAYPAVPAPSATAAGTPVPGRVR